MTSTLLLKDYKSKKPCPKCEAYRLITNDSEKTEETIHYHCLDCNFQFFETNEYREYSKRKKKKEKKDNTSNSLGLMLIILILSTIFAVTLSKQEERRDNQVGPASGLEEVSNIVG